MQSIKQESKEITETPRKEMSAVTGFTLGVLVCGVLITGALWWNSRLDNPLDSETASKNTVQHNNIGQSANEREQDSTLLKEAKTVAQSYWDTRFTQCGAYRYEFDYPGQTPVMLRQLKDVTVSTTEETLTDADKMNSIEWKGTTKVSASMHRGIAVNNLPNAHWLEWREGMPAGGSQNFVYIQKKKGKWFYDPDERGFFKRIDCATIPR